MAEFTTIDFATLYVKYYVKPNDDFNYSDLENIIDAYCQLEICEICSAQHRDAEIYHCQTCYMTFCQTCNVCDDRHDNYFCQKCSSCKKYVCYGCRDSCIRCGEYFCRACCREKCIILYKTDILVCNHCGVGIMRVKFRCIITFLRNKNKMITDIIANVIPR